MRLRNRLFLLVAGTVVPLVALAIVLGVVFATDEQEAFREGALARIRTFMLAVDAELRGHIRAAEALAASRSVADDQLQSFYNEAQRVLRSQPDWQNIVLTLPDGQQVLNLARPFGAALPMAPDVGTIQEVIVTKSPAVGNVFFGQGTGRYGVPVRVPVADANGRVRYVLTAVIDLAAFTKLIREQEIPSTWVIALIDSEARFVGRVPALAPDGVASADFRSAVRSSFEGWYRGLTLEQVDTYTAFKVSDVSGWSAGIAIPASVVNAGARNAAAIIVLGTLLSVGLALAFAFVLGRRIATPIAELAAAARAMGAGQAPLTPLRDHGIREVREVADALNEAASAIAERHALLEREQAALRETDRAKDAFLAMLGHELRNPLGAITTATQVLNIADPGTDMAAQSRKIIERQTRHMTRLIEDLLDISGVTMGKVTLKQEPFDLARLAHRVVNTWRRTRSDRDGHVEVDAEPVWVNADRARIEQVLSNLLDNADKFSPADRLVRVGVRRDGDDAVLEVIDEGEGIPADKLGQVFGLFVQFAPGPARTRGGMGVGLALVKRLVEMHGGTVAVASAGVGKGATFTVRLPAVPALTTSDPNDISSGRLGVLPSLRILVTEDNDDAREMMRAMLTMDRHQVDVARNGQEALAAVAASPPDVVLMDIGLPDMDGYEVARRLGQSEARGRMTLIALTGFGQFSDEQRAYEAGFDLHLTKPVPPEVLRKVLAAFARGEGGRP